MVDVLRRMSTPWHAVGVAFWGGLLAAVLLLFRRRQATMLFAIA